jgi:hypothetical protein
MKKHFMRKFLTSSIVALFLISLLYVPSAHASTTVTFTTEDIPVDTVFTVRLDLRVSVSTSSSIVFSGSSGSVGVDVSGDSATISVTYAGSMHSQSFTTPIGSLKIPIYTVALGAIYAKVTGSVRAIPQVKGDASISPTTISWTSSGSQSISVAHKGSIFSFDTITVELPFKYVLSIAVGIEALGSTLFEYSVDVGTLTGTPKVTQGLSTIPIATIIIIVVVVVAVLGFVVVRRRKPSPKPPLQK